MEAVTFPYSNYLYCHAHILKDNEMQNYLCHRSIEEQEVLLIANLENLWVLFILSYSL